MPLPVKSAMRTTWAGLGVSMVTGLAKRPPPRPASTSSVFEPGLIVTRLGRTAGRERSGGHARRRLQAGDLGRAAGIDRGQPGPGAIGDGGCEGAHRPGCAGRSPGRSACW